MTGTLKVAAKHDFRTKLRQESLVPAVSKYVTWQRERARCAREGLAEPPMPRKMGPLSINLDLTTACNYRCDHCIDMDILNTRNNYEGDSLRNSIDEMYNRGLKSVILIGGGEPTIFPKFSETVRYLKELGLQVAVVSNGSGNRKILEVADYLGERDWVRLSLDSGTNDTFVRMHKPVHKEVTLESICSWVPKIKAANPRFKVGFSFLITWRGAEQHYDDGSSAGIVENLHEIVQATYLAKESGFDYISLKPFLVRSATGSEVMDPQQAVDDLDEIRSRIRAAVVEAKRYESDSFKVLESTNLRMLLTDTWRNFTNQPHVCHMQALRQVLTPTGLYNCPAHRGVAHAKIAEKGAYDGAINAYTTSRNVFRILESFDAHQECAEVTCIYNEANWWLDQAIQNGEEPDLGPLSDQPDFFL